MTSFKQLLWRCVYCNNTSLSISAWLIGCSDCGGQYYFKNDVWECATDFTPTGFTVDRSQHVLDLEQNHFWFSARDRLLRTKLLALKRPEEHRLLDLGCGSGRMLSALAQDFSQTVGIEGHHNALARATQRCQDSQLLHANVLASPLYDQQFDWVVSFDVLEHVQPQALLSEAFRLTRPGGRLLLSVPAFPILWSMLDQLAGHRCRYRLKQLTDELNAAGWQLRGHTYFQCLLFPLLAASRWLNRNKTTPLERKPPASVNQILSFCNNMEVKLCHRLTLPFGSSLIVWADKPKHL